MEKNANLKHGDIIGKMTLDEKVSLLSGKNFWETMDLKSFGIPSIFLCDGPTGLRKQAKAADQLGLNPSIPSTCFPSSSTIANSWDPSVSESVGSAIGEEALAADVSVLLGPGVNIKRNPRCGRNFEYYSEDPLLAGKMASGFIRGLQSHGIAACVKHFACNNQETRRLTIDSVLDERTLREIYLPAFEIAVKEAGVKAVMSSYNKINGTYANENRHLYRILREEWGFKGIVVTDWGGDNDRVEALEAGDDLEMPTTGGETNLDVKAAIEHGQLKEAILDERIDCLLDLILSLPKTGSGIHKTFDKATHHLIAQKAAEESIVLLKNDGSVLPLKKGQKVAIVGEFAKKPRFQGAGSSIVNPLKLDSILGCAKEYDIDLVGYEPGFERYGKASDKLIKKAVALASRAEIVVTFIGLDEITEAEGIDRGNIRLPDNQRELISALYHTGKKIVLVINCGAVIEMPFEDRASAIVHGYLGGEAGARAMLNVLTGKVNPSGKLAETYSYGYTDVPSADHFARNDKTVEYREGIYVGYRYFTSAGIDVRFPFGFGLSYTKFAYSGLQISPTGVSFKITNVGKVAGKEIAQLYIGLKDGKVFRPVQELKGFSKVTLEPGETKDVTIAFDDRSFSYFNVKTSTFEIEEGDYDILIGSSCEDVRLSGKLHQNGTSAPNPYDPVLLPHYYSHKVRSVPNEEFELLIGHKAPLTGQMFIRKNRILIDYNSSVSDLRYSKGWTGRLFSWGIRTAIKLLRAIGKRSDANTLIMGVYYQPMRGLSRMTGGGICWKQLDGLILMFNGHCHKGVHKFFKEGRIKSKQRKAENKRLVNQQSGESK